MTFRNSKGATAPLLIVACAIAAGLAGCVVQPEREVVYRELPPPRPVPRPVPDDDFEAPPPAVSVYVEPPIEEPEPVAVEVAPPPLLVDVPPPRPYPGAVWTGGYWTWQGGWVWCAGRWLAPPQPAYVWMPPYYEYRGGAVIFIAGYWRAPDRPFVPPTPGLHFHIEVNVGGPGVRPIGPPGVFVPPPPGSRIGLIVPAPIGTPPQVVIGAPPVIAPGMRVQVTANSTTNINNTRVTNVTNITNVTHVTNVTVVAPAAATRTGQAFRASVPATPHLAAMQRPVVRQAAPRPLSATPLPVYRPGQRVVALPPAQPVRVADHPFRPAAAGTPPGRWPEQAPAQGIARPQDLRSPAPGHELPGQPVPPREQAMHAPATWRGPAADRRDEARGAVAPARIPAVSKPRGGERAHREAPRKAKDEARKKSSDTER